MKLDKKTIISSLGIILFPIINFYLLEGYTHNGWEEVRPWAQLFNILVLELLTLILFFVFRNLAAALRVESILLMVVGLINYYVYTFRSSPLVPWDIFSIKTGISVADNYDFTPSNRVVIVVFLFLLVIFLEGFCKLSLKEWKYYKSLGGATIFCLLLVLFSKQLQVESFQNQHRLYNKLFTPVFMWQVNGFVVTFIMDLPYLAVDKPLDYNKEEIQATLESYQETAVADTSDGEEVKPNIIVIMDEAFSDLNVLGDFVPSEDYMPFYHSLVKGAENTVTGSLGVSVCGGNTANTEFEFLTGNTMAFLPQGSIPYQQYVKEEIPAIPSYLKGMGYETYALHPYYENGWDRDRVYPMLGFDQSYFIQDFFDKKHVREYVSDRTCMEKIIQLYEQKKQDTPAFIFNVTMQNHGSYSEPHENFNPYITVEGKEQSYSLSSYLTLLRYTDEALKELITYFSKEEEPTMIVFFGDHQPNDTVAEPIWELNGATYLTVTEEQGDLRYEVPYVMWANFDIDEGTEADTSINYLGARMLREAELPLPSYQNFLLELQKEYPVISARRIADVAGDKVEEKKEEEGLLQYQKIQYYQLFDAVKE